MGCPSAHLPNQANFLRRHVLDLVKLVAEDGSHGHCLHVGAFTERIRLEAMELGIGGQVVAVGNSRAFGPILLRQPKTVRPHSRFGYMKPT